MWYSAECFLPRREFFGKALFPFLQQEQRLKNPVGLNDFLLQVEFELIFGRLDLNLQIFNGISGSAQGIRRIFGHGGQDSFFHCAHYTVDSVDVCLFQKLELFLEHGVDLLALCVVIGKIRPIEPAAIKYHSVTYIGPFIFAMGTSQLTANSASPTRAIGSIQNGVSPHSKPWAPNDIARCVLCVRLATQSAACSVGPKIMPAAVLSTIACQA